MRFYEDGTGILHRTWTLHAVSLDYSSVALPIQHGHFDFIIAWDIPMTLLLASWCVPNFWQTMLANLSLCSTMFRYHSCSKVVMELCSTMFHNVPQCSTMFHYVPPSNYHMLHYYFMSTSVSFLGWSRNQTRMLSSLFFCGVPEANPRCESYWIKEYPLVNHCKTIGKTIGKWWLNGILWDILNLVKLVYLWKKWKNR